MMSKHTPGPWNYTMYKDSGWDFKLTADHGETEIVSGCGCCDSPWVSSEADARLIAAAPDLLEAIEAAIASGMIPGESITGGPGAKTQQGKAAAMLRAAIAKAKGEE